MYSKIQEKSNKKTPPCKFVTGGKHLGEETAAITLGLCLTW